MADSSRLAVTASSSDGEIDAAVRQWVDAHIPEPWRQAAAVGHDAIRSVRSRQDYTAWYPVFAASGLVMATWPLPYGGLGLTPRQARVAEHVIAPYNLGRLNPLGLHNAASALFAHGTEEQRLRFLPPMVANVERWCQMFSEPNAGSDLASLAMRAERDGDEWILTGQKVWSTWAHASEFAICLARTDPTVPKRQGITYFIVDLRAPGVEVRPLRHMGGLVEFNEVWLDEVRIADFHRIGAVGDGWRVAAATLSGERQMSAGSGSGGMERIGGMGADHLLDRVRGTNPSPVVRQRIMRVYIEERIRRWTNDRVRATVKAGGTPGPAASIGKVHQGSLNQSIQRAATDLLGLDAIAWPTQTGSDWTRSMPLTVKGMFRSIANTIEGGTTEVNKNVLGEQILGLPREPDQYHGQPWQDIPRNG